jgi:hypothetical protein
MLQRVGDTDFRILSMPGNPEIDLDSFDSYTRLDAVLSARHA